MIAKLILFNTTAIKGRYKMNNTTDYICSLLPTRLAEYVASLPAEKAICLKELRLRIERPLALKFGSCLTHEECIFAEKQGIISRNDIDAVTARLSDHSMNSVKDKLKLGFIPLKYGCRAGIAGEILLKNDKVDFQYNINSISLRIAHEYKDCARSVFDAIYDGGKVLNTVIISPPMMGKTTLLRDLARLLGNITDVCVIDERSEIASCFNGIAQFDIGKRTDIFDGCPKAEGIAMAIRSMSPSVIITDEIGNANDGIALAEAARCGVSFIATLHADSLSSARRRNGISTLFDDGIIKKAVILGNSHGIGTVEAITTI